eukprot:8391369-Pyramimonas_sp.AAC.1
MSVVSRGHIVSRAPEMLYGRRCTVLLSLSTALQLPMPKCRRLNISSMFFHGPFPHTSSLKYCDL